MKELWKTVPKDKLVEGVVNSDEETRKKLAANVRSIL
jgi:hypothetical protein